MLWCDQRKKQALLNMNAILTNTNGTFFFFPIKKLVQKNVSFYKDLSFPNHSERNLGHLPILVSIMRLRDTSLKTGI